MSINTNYLVKKVMIDAYEFNLLIIKFSRNICLLKNTEQTRDFVKNIKVVMGPFQGGASFVDPFCYLCFVFVMLSCLFIVAL